jgi:hypothetical protein
LIAKYFKIFYKVICVKKKKGVSKGESLWWGLGQSSKKDALAMEIFFNWDQLSNTKREGVFAFGIATTRQV